MHSAHMLAELVGELTAAGVRVQAVEARSSVRDRLRNEGVDAKLGLDQPVHLRGRRRGGISTARPRPEDSYEAPAQRDPSQSAALAAGVRARGVCRREAQARGAHAALRAVRPGHRAVGRTAESRHRIRGGQDGRRGRRPAQRHVGKPDRTGHRAHGLARRAIHAGEGVRRRRDCHQHVVHVGRIVSPRRTQAPRAGIQPGQRPHSSGAALSGHDRAADSFGGLGSRLRGGGVHPEVERGSGGAAHR